MDEQLRILKMIEEGTITAEQGAELMSAMNTDPQELQTATPKSRSSYDKKMFRILVSSTSGDKVKIQFPVFLLYTSIREAETWTVPSSYCWKARGRFRPIR